MACSHAKISMPVPVAEYVSAGSKKILGMTASRNRGARAEHLALKDALVDWVGGQSITYSD